MSELSVLDLEMSCSRYEILRDFGSRYRPLHVYQDLDSDVKMKTFAAQSQMHHFVY